ncbi:MAG: hypothetical protein WA485_00360 [Candidatus Sulfotelmatobacter sp.]
MDRSSLPISKKPFDVHAQGLREGPKLVVKDMAVIVFDFGDCSSIELNPEPSELP